MTGPVPRIVVLDGQTVNPGDTSWAPIEALGTLVLFERTRDNIRAALAGEPIHVVNPRHPQSR